MSAPITDEQLAEIKARNAARTSGPWEKFTLDIEPNELGKHKFPTITAEKMIGVQTSWKHGQLKDHVGIVRSWVSPYYVKSNFPTMEDGDAEFIAHAPDDIAALLAEVDRLRAEMVAAQKLCEIYFNVAAAAVGEDAVREARDSEIAWGKALASTTPEQAEKIRARIRAQLVDAMVRDTKMNDDPARIEAEARASVALGVSDFVSVDMAAPGASDYSESVKRLQASVLTMAQALRIVDAIGSGERSIAERVVELLQYRADRDPMMAWRQARTEFVLRVANEGERE